MDYYFPRYLTAKRSVDDRALNRAVWQALSERLSAMEGRPSLAVLELGGGVGTMFERLAEWGALSRAEYTLVDAEGENIQVARRRLSEWAAYQRLEVLPGQDRLLLHGGEHTFMIELVKADVHDFFKQVGSSRQWDLIIAHAFLDLMDVPKILPTLKILLRTGGLLYLTINFDGLTAFEPVSQPELDEKILGLYHKSMDRRMTDGQASSGSRTGRHLFHWLEQAGLQILSAGSSDWIVYGREGKYPEDEAYFLHFILHFFEESLRGHPDLDRGELDDWLAERRRQIETGDLVYLAHQLDFLVQAG